MVVHSLYIYQFQIIAVRDEILRQEARSNVTITVLRNQNSPVFTEDVYPAVIAEKDTNTLFYILTVNATDLDGVSYLQLTIYQTSPAYNISAVQVF